MPADAGWLAPAEAELASGMRFPKRRTEYLLRRWVGKQAVARVLGLPETVASMRRIEIATLPGGAPEAVVDGVPLRQCVSLSDRAGWAVCLFCGDAAAVGCDLELVEPRSPAFVGEFLTVPEQRLVAAASAGEPRDETANLLWSAKESAFKVLRTGLRRDTRSAEVVPQAGGLPGEWSPLRVRLAEGGELAGWWARFGSFVVTVAADRAIEPPTPLHPTAALAAAEPSHSWLSGLG